MRESFFIQINNLMYKKYYGHTDLPMPAYIQIFNNFSYTTIYLMKYVFTLLWTFLFFTLNYIAIMSFKKQKRTNLWLICIYAGISLIAVISMLYGYLAHSQLQDSEYSFSKWLVGVLQSPFICLFLLLTETLNTNTKNNLL
ncbi:MAG: hypothetical protein JSU07_11375 [Bacteroidetes bacterium]|nr:hypothetical protein [Bacteroidota bacterium]